MLVSLRLLAYRVFDVQLFWVEDIDVGDEVQSDEWILHVWRLVASLHVRRAFSVAGAHL